MSWSSFGFNKAPYLKELTKVERYKAAGEAKAMKPSVFPSEYSELLLNLSIAIWEETINQIMFQLWDMSPNWHVQTANLTAHLVTPCRNPLVNHQQFIKLVYRSD